MVPLAELWYDVLYDVWWASEQVAHPRKSYAPELLGGVIVYLVWTGVGGGGIVYRSGLMLPYTRLYDYAITKTKQTGR